MVEQMTAHDELTHEEINDGPFTIRGVWTCNSPELPDSKEHVMDKDETARFEKLADDFGVHHHDNCLDCEAHNNHYEGDLDRVEIVDESGTVVQTIEPEVLVEEYDMAGDYNKFT